MDKDGLTRFEEGIKDLFLRGGIRYPVHLSKGNEDELLEIFKYREGDWVFSTHRNHYHALLSGFPADELREWIVKNGSMHVYRERFFTSGIVGGCVPIAVGVAMGIKSRGGREKVWCFVGDMGAKTGIFNECFRYASGQKLPITFIVEDNGYSVDSPTEEVWGDELRQADWVRYKYQRQYPHTGCGEWVTF